MTIGIEQIVYATIILTASVCGWAGLLARGEYSGHPGVFADWLLDSKKFTKRGLLYRNITVSSFILIIALIIMYAVIR